MSGQQYSVEISVGVIEKLAGLKKPAPKPTAPTGLKPGGAPFTYGGNPEVIALAKGDAALSKALATSRRVGSMLVKQEDTELAAVKTLSKDLLKKHRYQEKEVPCGRAREAVIECYAANPDNTLRCADHVSAYSHCADRAYADYVKRVSKARRA